MKKIKNYLILFLIMITTFIICLYLFSWLKQYNDAKLENPIITEVLQEVKYNNLDDFFRERDFAIIYACTTSEKVCRNFENKFVEYIKEENLNDEIYYFNLGEKTEENNNLNKLYNKYKSDNLLKKVTDYPTLFVFNNGKIIDVLSKNDDEQLTLTSVADFLKGYDIEND